MKRVEVTGWKHGFLPISFVKLLRESGVQRLSLAEATDLVDQMLSGEPINIDFHADGEAAAFVRQAVKARGCHGSPDRYAR